MILFAFHNLIGRRRKSTRFSISSLLPGDLMTLCLFSLPTFEFYEAHATIPWEEKPIMAHCKEFQTFDLFVDNGEEKKRFNTFPGLFLHKVFLSPSLVFCLKVCRCPFLYWSFFFFWYFLSRMPYCSFSSVASQFSSSPRKNQKPSPSLSSRLGWDSLG